MKKSYRAIIIPLFLAISVPIVCRADEDNHQWTWLYYKILSKRDYDNLSGKKELSFLKENVSLFSQLIFSWNAFRPSQGYFSFYIRARDAITKKWGSWYKMMEWGAETQRSFGFSKDKKTGYFYVRLEVDPKNLADAFHVKVQVHEGADLAKLKACAVSLSNFNKFEPEVAHDRIKSLPSIYIDNVPRMSQFAKNHPRDKELCSPTSCSMVTEFLANMPINRLEFAEHVLDHGLDIYGSWPFNTAHIFERSGGAALIFTARLNSFLRLYQRLELGIPMAVSVRGELVGAASEYKNGHIMVVVGWDKENQEVVCHDPAFRCDDDVVRRYPLESFLTAWERSRRLVYLVEPFNL